MRKISPTTGPREKIMTGQLVSIQVGTIQRLVAPQSQFNDGSPAFWKTAIYKNPITGPLKVTKEALEGDESADHRFHGGPDNIALAYNIAHYDHWRKVLSAPNLPFGAFGENFSLTNFSEENTCIGDIWQIGDGKNAVHMQVTQARQPCFKLARRIGTPDIVKMVRETTWGGWYLRTLKEGTISPGMPIKLVESPHPDWPVSLAVQTMYTRRKNVERAQALAQLPELSTRWKTELVED